MKKATWIWLSAAVFAGVVACTDEEENDPRPEPVEECGDNKCTGDETTSTCPKDCSAKTDVCGDKVCGATENASTCAADCGGAVCGNKTCEVGETTSCPNDCPSSLKTVNASSYTIFTLYVAACGSTTWGVDQTGTGYIAAGSSLTLNGIPPGCYHFRAETSGAAQYWQTTSAVTLQPSSQFTWTLNN